MTSPGVFTDVQLKRFKELVKQQQEETIIDTNSAIWVYANLRDLLARLDRAESNLEELRKILEAVRNEHFRHRCDHGNPCSLCIALENYGRHRRWKPLKYKRKSKGGASD